MPGPKIQQQNHLADVVKSNTKGKKMDSKRLDPAGDANRYRHPLPNSAWSFGTLTEE